MRRRNHKGAIELSANFIVIMIISAVVVVGGLGLFFKMAKGAQKYTDTLDTQTEDNIKSMMLSSTYDLAIYPTEFTITNGNAKLFGVGIKNTYEYEGTFTITLATVKRYDSPDTPGSTDLSAGHKDDYSQISSDSIKIPTNSQVTKGVLLKMPTGATKGEYVYTINVKNGTGITTSYGNLQVYVHNN